MNEWKRVTKRNGCPICGKYDWCGVAADGTAVCCMRVESGKQVRNGGWIHRLNTVLPAQVHVRVVTPDRLRPSVNWEARQATLTRSLTDARVALLSSALSVSVCTLEAFSVGYHEGWEAYTMPMYDAEHEITGFQTRSLAGKKMSLKGSRQGLFSTGPMELADEVFVAEGFSDTAALVDWGLLAIGRPGCQACVGLACETVGRRRAIIIADAGIPGEKGAWRLAEELKRTARGVKVVTPPRPYNDVREWKAAGADVEDLLELCEERSCV